MVSVLKPSLYASIPSVLYSDCSISKGVSCVCLAAQQVFISRKQHAVNVTERKLVLVSIVATNS